MVLAHQTQMHNWITLTNYQTRIALADPKETPEDLRQRVEASAEQLVRYLLFTNEVPLQTPIGGTSDFARQFSARGPRDSEGRSLRDFDLQKRIFKYPCSYLIYSEAFDAIPSPAKDYVYRRLFEILSGREQSPEFASLSSQDRRAILEILVATKPGVPEEWKQFVRDADQGPPACPRERGYTSNRYENRKEIHEQANFLENQRAGGHRCDCQWPAYFRFRSSASGPSRESRRPLGGHHDATGRYRDPVPSRYLGSGNQVVGTLHNGGDDMETTTSASIENGVVKLHFEHYLTSIEATLKDGELDGKIIVARRSAINITPGKLSEAPGDTFTPFPRQALCCAYGRSRGECSEHQRRMGNAARFNQG